MAFRIISASGSRFSAAPRVSSTLRAALMAFALIAVAPAALAQPAPPDTVEATAVAAGAITVDVTQSTPTGVTAYLCETSPDGSAWITATCTVTAGTPGTDNAITLSVTGLTDGDLYYVRVAATGGATPSAFAAATAPARPNDGPIPAAIPANLAYISPAAGSATLTWDAVTDWGYGGTLNTTPGTDGGYAYECQETGTPFTGTPTGTAATNSVAITTWNAAQTYHCQVQAIGTNSATSAWGAELSDIAPVGPPPPPPPPAATSIPTLGEWSVIILSLLLIAGVVLSRRRFG